MAYRLGLDMGASSIGWAIVELRNVGGKLLPVKVIAIGSRIFSDSRDAKSRTPLSVQKRMAKQARKNRDRRLQRTEILLKSLKSYGLLPANISEAKREELKNPYQLRALGLKENIGLYGLGRALFHINKRRGFKSNRKADRFADKDEGSAMKKSITGLREILNGRTLGEYLFERLKNKNGTRMRAQIIKGKNAYEIYADRAMYEDEFNRIWDAQAKFNKSLTADKKQKIFNIIFTQRELKIPERGWCEFENSERRAYLALPVSQHFRIWQEVNQLEVVSLDSDEWKLSDEDRQKLAAELLKGKSEYSDKNGMISFAKIKKLLGLKKDMEFNLESEKRKGLQCDKTAFVMASEDCFGNGWFNMDEASRDALIEEFIQAQDDKKLTSHLVSNFNFSEEKAAYIAEKALDLPDGTASLSAKAMKNILEFLRKGNIYNKAVDLAGYSFVRDFDGEHLDKLPYYGEVLQGAVMGQDKNANPDNEPEKYFGKIANPTVHVALNQLRKVVNKIMEVYGKPEEISIELARDLPLGEKGLAELSKSQFENQKKNAKIAEELQKLNVANNYTNRMKYKVWEDMGADVAKRQCPFCGKPVASLTALFSDDFDIEHLLPYSKTFDDSRANKVISCSSCNRIFKRNKTPYEAFGHNPNGYNWKEILDRAFLLHPSKRWRFEPDAMEIFEDKNGDIIARMLNDTRYMSRVGREYLSSIIHMQKIYTVNGRITGLLRGKWGLNAVLYPESEGDELAIKNRLDHRHHAIDAFIVACIDRNMVANISRLAKMAEEANLSRLLPTMPDPLPNFDHADFRNIIESIFVSHKLERGGVKQALDKGKTVGKLHLDTAYGPILSEEKESKYITIAKRIALSSLGFSQKNIKEVANAKIQSDLMRIFDGISRMGVSEKEKEKEWLAALNKYSEETNIRRLRIHIKRESYKLIPIKDKSGEIYKYMDNSENYCMDIYLPFGKSDWCFEAINMYDAHNSWGNPNWRKKDPRSKLVMRLFKNDIIAYEENDKTVLARVCGLASHGQISIVPLTLAKIDGNPPKKMPNSLQKLNARKVYVDEIGRLFDPKNSSISK